MLPNGPLHMIIVDALDLDAEECDCCVLCDLIGGVDALDDLVKLIHQANSPSCGASWHVVAVY